MASLAIWRSGEPVKNHYGDALPSKRDGHMMTAFSNPSTRAGLAKIHPLPISAAGDPRPRRNRGRERTVRYPVSTADPTSAVHFSPNDR